jgi:hypothetical protein
MSPIRYAITVSYQRLFFEVPPGKAINIENEIENTESMEDKKNRKEKENSGNHILCRTMYEQDVR